jgi:hypothetical protein
VFDRNSGAQHLLAVGTSGDPNYTPHTHPMASYEQLLRGGAGGGQAILVGDLRSSEASAELFRQLREAGAVSYAGLPLRGEQRLLGMLELIDSEPNCFRRRAASPISSPSRSSRRCSRKTSIGTPRRWKNACRNARTSCR